MAGYETVIGLEVHIQLSTATKAFCACLNGFGAPPNTQVCPVCLGMPGVLPVLNRKAFEYSLRVALALDFKVQKTIKFDRKNYYYPDLPKNYQISQYDMPVAYEGRLDICVGGVSKRIGITRAHLEEDAGKLIHDPSRPYSYVDLNRTGTPLLEIVSEPDLRTPEEAYCYLTALKQTIKYLDVSDCNMEEGSLRCDANISLRPSGRKQFGTKVEIKNLNSFKAVREALEYERERQADILDDGGEIVQETRLWNENRKITESMRTKEQAHDYRYFPEPDLVPFDVDMSLLESVKETLPELPQAKRTRFREVYNIKEADIEALTSEKEIADHFEDAVAGCRGDEDLVRGICNWITGEVLMHMNERGTDIKGLGISPGASSEIVGLVKKGAISNLAAKGVFRAHIETGKPLLDIVAERGLEQLSDASELEEIVRTVIKDNERSVNDYRAGKKNALSFLIGQVMKATAGKANPKIAGDIIRREIEG